MTGFEWVELFVAIVALLALIGSGGQALARPRSRTFWALIGAAAVVFVIRWMLAEPSFVHASLHGPRLLEHPYKNPYEAFRGYGPVAPLVHGWILRYVDADLTWIALVHQLCMSFALVPLAWLAGRLAGSQVARIAMIGVFVVGALHPVLVRIGASEDAHAIAVLFACIGLAAIHDYVETADKSRLVLASSALILMMYTRQIMVIVVPFAYLLAFAQRPKLLFADRWFRVAVVGAGALVLLRLVALGANPDQAFHAESLAVRFPNVGIVIATVRHHPLFDVGLYQPMFVPLWILGAVAAWRGSRLGKGFVVLFAVMFASTFWLYEGRNVALMFRMPLLTIACGLAGVGFQRLFAAVEQRFGARVANTSAGIGGGVILLVPLVMPGWAIVEQIRPLTVEYRAVQANTDALPEQFVLIVNPGGGIDRPGHQFPTHLLRGAGLDVVQHTPHDVVRHGKLDERLIFFSGTPCYAYSMIELSNLPALDFASIIEAIGEPAANHELPDGFSIPAAMRPECVMLLDGARPLGERTWALARPFDVPFELYGVDEFEMGFYELTPEAVRTTAEQTAEATR